MISSSQRVQSPTTECIDSEPQNNHIVMEEIATLETLPLFGTYFATLNCDTPETLLKT